MAILDEGAVKLLPCPLCQVALQPTIYTGWDGEDLPGAWLEHPAGKHADCPIAALTFLATPEKIAAWNRRTLSPAADIPSPGSGWRLVPVEPTETMIAAGWIDKEDVSPDEIWLKMIEAAPPLDLDTVAQRMLDAWPHNSAGPRGQSHPLADREKSAAIYANTQDLELVAALCQPGTCVAHGKDIAFYIGTPPARTGYSKLTTDPLYAAPNLEARGDGVRVTDDMVKRAEIAAYGVHKRGFIMRPLIGSIDMRRVLEAALPPLGDGSAEIVEDHQWRDLALQFDGHRIEALSLLRYVSESRNCAEATGRAGEIKAFLSKPPLSGEAVLAARIRALSPNPGDRS